MKLDKIAFAKVVAWCVHNGMSIGTEEVEELDRLIDIPVPEQPPAYVSDSHVNLLLAAMNQPGKKIEAIKAYRSLTGAGLKESKDAVERYWNESPRASFDGDNFYTK